MSSTATPVGGGAERLVTCISAWACIIGGTPRKRRPNSMPCAVSARPLPDFLEGGLDEFVAAETIAAKGLFDYTYYLARQPDVRAAKVDPLLHFCTHGWREGRKPNHLFDPKWYLTQYPECRRGDLNPLLHYIWRGEQAGHKPGPLFNPTAYRESHRLPPEQSPLSHRLMAVVKRRTAWARGLPAVLPIASVLATNRA